MPVSLTTSRGLGTVCTSTQWEPAQVELLGAQPFPEGNQPHSPSQNHTPFTCPLCPRETTHQSTAASVIAHQREVHPGEGNNLLENSEDRFKRHAARIFMAFATIPQTSVGTRVYAFEHHQTPYLRMRIDWAVSPLRETQSRPRPLQRKVSTKASSLHRAVVCRGE